MRLYIFLRTENSFFSASAKMPVQIPDGIFYLPESYCVTTTLGSLFVPSPNPQISFWSPIPWPDWKSVHSLSCVLIPVFFVNCSACSKSESAARAPSLPFSVLALEVCRPLTQLQSSQECGLRSHYS